MLAAGSDPCIGYVIREIPRDALSPASATPRKLVILGDTYDACPIIPLVHADASTSASISPGASTSGASLPTPAPISWSSPHIDFSVLPFLNPHDNGTHVLVPVSLLVHEATDAYLPPNIDPQQRTGKNRTAESVTEKTVLRGHSTPAMAGAFARAVGAEKLVLNHIGARHVFVGVFTLRLLLMLTIRLLIRTYRFPAPEMEHSNYHGGGRNQFRLGCMREIERQAAVGWNSKRRMQPYVQAAWDYLTVPIPPNKPREVIDVDDGQEDVFARLLTDHGGTAERPGKGKSRATGSNQPRLSEDTGMSLTAETEYISEFEWTQSMGPSVPRDGDHQRTAADAGAITGSHGRGYGTRSKGARSMADHALSDRKRSASTSDGPGASDLRAGPGFRSRRGRGGGHDGRRHGEGLGRGVDGSNRGGGGWRGRHKGRERG